MGEINYAGLIPEDSQMRMMELANTDTKTSWSKGEEILIVVQYNKANNPMVLMNDIWAACGAIHGDSIRTTREYAMVREFYPRSVSDNPEYEILSYSHFRIAKRVPDWEGALNWAVEQVDILGRPATVDSMYMKFREHFEDDDTDSILADDEDSVQGTPITQYARFGQTVDSLREQMMHMPFPQSDPLVQTATVLLSTLEELLEKYPESVLE